VNVDVSGTGGLAAADITTNLTNCVFTESALEGRRLVYTCSGLKAGKYVAKFETAKYGERAGE
jgi:hypothetical protein